MRIIFALTMMCVLILSGCGQIVKTGIPECDWKEKSSDGKCGAMCPPRVYYNNENNKCEVLNGAGCDCSASPFGPNLGNETLPMLFNECKNSTVINCVEQKVNIMIDASLNKCKAKCEING